MNTNAHKVVIAENGPYLVSGSVPLAVQVIAPNTEGLSWDWVQGRLFQAEASYTLCRCGASATKPFCATGAISAAVSMMAGTYLDVSTERYRAQAVIAK